MKSHNEFPAQTKKALGPESDEDKKMYKGCGKELSPYLNCGNASYLEDIMLCEDCQLKKDAVYTEGEKNEQ